MAVKSVEMRVLKGLFSGWFMGVLLLVFAFVIGYATFVENDFGAAGSKALVYNTTWFEVLLFLMVVNFAGMIFTKKLYKKAKLNVLLIHVALVIIIVGAGVTRYFGYEGQMHIRDGKISNVFQSADTYLNIALMKDGVEKREYSKLLLTNAKQNLFSKKYKIQDEKIEVAVLQYLPKAKEVVVPATEGPAYIKVVLGNKNGQYQFFLKEGTERMEYEFGVSFGDTTSMGLAQIINKEGKLYIRMPNLFTSNDSILQESLKFVPLQLNSIYNHNSTPFVVAEFIEAGAVVYQEYPKDSPLGSPMVKLKVEDEEFYMPLREEKTIQVNNVQASLIFDNLLFELPFFLRLNKFDLERYPGSNSPSSFASEITVIDKDKNEEFPYRIYMNHILNYRGYRFFQSSYDQDEMGTVLSVNHDFWGTTVTYVGYFFLFLSLILSFFTSKTRFARITQQLKDVHEKRKSLSKTGMIALAILFGAQTLWAQNTEAFDEHAKAFGQLFVQNKEGRTEPINTLANKILVKITKKASYNKQGADVVFLEMVTNREKWQAEPVIKVPEASVQAVLGISDDHASFADFFDEKGQYKIGKAVEEAYQRKPALRSQHDKALINVDERINVLYMVLNSSVLKIFPLKGDDNNKWVTPNEHHKKAGHGNEVGDLWENYTASLLDAQASGNFKLANENLEKIKAYQRELGGNIMPSETKVKLEIFYNEANIFKTLFPIYMMLGVVLVSLFFLQTFKPTLEFKILNKVLLVAMLIAFAAQTIGLGIRWYISGHAPWSNGYESMIYISWATILAGFIFMKRSRITLGVTALLAGITLLTAHMSWLNPELTNLVPVLKSHWLTIHVATITASYGFLGLGCMVAFLNMCMMIFRNKKNLTRINLTLKELNLIIEMSISAGLVLLVIGNFLGGIWANESWGRYWGWDPKETWTLVTIILYSFTLHLTLIPAIRNVFSFSFMSFISFGAVLMTYFGVNYYLSGLHSYAAGDPIGIPSFVYYAIVVIAIVSLLAGMNQLRMRKYDKVKKGKKVKA